MSRFMRQLLAETSLEIETKHLDFTRKNAESKESCICGMKKDGQKLEKYAESLLSPSALNKYMNCPLSFYYRYMAGLKQEEEIDTLFLKLTFNSLIIQVILVMQLLF